MYVPAVGLGTYVEVDVGHTDERSVNGDKESTLLRLLTGLPTVITLIDVRK
jgi:hypothetical protein